MKTYAEASGSGRIPDPGTYRALVEHLRANGPALVAFSGGVDSSFLLAAAHEALGDEVRAVIGVSPSLQRENLDRAHRIAKELSVPLEEHETKEMENFRYRANDANRCYFCKAHLFGLLHEIATGADGRLVYDGTHAGDRGEERPGRRAAKEFGIRSPLDELGWTKEQIRTESHRIGLETWDQPASPCLSSRLQRGVAVTVSALRRIESGEQWLRGRGFATVRVRDQGGWARVEVSSDDVATCLALEPEITEQLVSLGFSKVSIDPAGYRSGGGNNPREDSA